MKLRIELDREADGRWIAEVPEIPGAMVYGATAAKATAMVKAVALRALADRLEMDESGSDLDRISFATD
jgi:predicted RNase H-like HicB family nuclease